MPARRPFDPLGPAVRELPLSGGRTARYVDAGARDWPAFAFVGGAGTSVRAFRLFEFARSLREELGLRVVSVERNGFGQTPFDPALALRDYARDVHEVLNRLGIGHAALVAVSGGGPYVAQLAAREPERVRSLHLACAVSDRAGSQGSDWLDVDDDALLAACATLTRDPASWWAYPPDSPVHRVPGFTDSAVEEGTRAFFAAGQMGAPEPLAHERRLLRDTPLPDLSGLAAPAYLYWGSADALVPATHLERWRAVLPHVAAVRRYEGEGHDVQYRHWDHVLLDLAGRQDEVPAADLFDWG